MVLITWSFTSELLNSLLEDVDVQFKLWLQLSGPFVNEVNSSQNLPFQHSAVHYVTGIVWSADMALSQTYLKANDFIRVSAVLHNIRKPKPVKNLH